MSAATGSSQVGPGTISASRRNPHLMRWWVWPLLVILLAAAAMIAIRAHGWTRWQSVQRDLVTLGMPTTAGEFIVAMPPVDRGRQERLGRALRAVGGWCEWRAGLPFEDLREGAYPPDSAESLRQVLRDGEADIAAIAAILGEGPVQLTLGGWIERDPAAVERMTPADLATLRFPSLLASRACAAWWAAAAWMAEDPAPHLQRLRTWLDGLDRPCLLLDVTTAIAVADLRDSIHLWLATRGRLAGSDLESWIVEQPVQLRWGADGLAGERCLSWEPQMRSGPLAVAMGGPLAWSDDLTDRMDVRRYHQGAWVTAELARLETGLRGAPPPPAFRHVPFGLGGSTDGLAPNLMSTVVAVVEADYRHRLVRLAGLLAARHRAGRGLPAETTALEAILPTAILDARSALQPAIRYQRLSPSRFRIGLDPTLPPPPLIAAERWTADYGTAIGKPASAETVRDLHWSLEIDLDAILIPLPEPVVFPGGPGAPER